MMDNDHKVPLGRHEKRASHLSTPGPNFRSGNAVAVLRKRSPTPLSFRLSTGTLGFCQAFFREAGDAARDASKESIMTRYLLAGAAALALMSGSTLAQPSSETVIV